MSSETETQGFTYPEVANHIIQKNKIQPTTMFAEGILNEFYEKEEVQQSSQPQSQKHSSQQQSEANEVYDAYHNMEGTN